MKRRHLIPTLALLASLASAHAGMLSIDQQVGRCDLIVRAAVTGWTDTLVHYTITRTIYGHTNITTLDLDLTFNSPALRKSFLEDAAKEFHDANHRDPSPDELLAALMSHNGIVKDRQVILLLREVPARAHNIRYQSAGTCFDVPPNHSLDATESQIIASLNTGDFLNPNPLIGDLFADELRQSPLIVRATLEQTTDATSTWRITKTLKGEIAASTITIPNTLFITRAAAIVQHSPTPQGPPNPIPLKAHELITKELTPNRQAILFLSDIQSDKDTTTATLIRRTYEDPAHPQLDILEKSIAHPTHDIPL